MDLLVKEPESLLLLLLLSKERMEGVKRMRFEGEARGLAGERGPEE